MSAIKPLVIGIGLEGRKSKTNPYGIIVEVETFDGVNVTKNVLADVESFAGIRKRFNDLYGNIVYKMCHIDTYTDYDLCAIFGTEMDESDKYVLSGDCLVNRNNGDIVAMPIKDDNDNVHYFKCNRTTKASKRHITFKNTNFRKLFYLLADTEKGWHTPAKRRASVAQSKRRAMDCTVSLVMALDKGGTIVKATTA